jgi:hypothetical protein
MFYQKGVLMIADVEVAKFLNITIDAETGQVFLEIEILDPVWKSKIKNNIKKIKIILEEVDANL